MNAKAMTYAKKSPDIAYHVETLTALATGNRVVEFGVRTGYSTAAFMAGGPTWLMSYDIDRPYNLDQLKQLALDCAVEWIFTQGNDLRVTIEPCDVLFIDTRHTGEQLAAELALHAYKVRKYIVMHDTAMDLRTDDCNSFEMMQSIGYFVGNGAEWIIKSHDVRGGDFGRGLTILERVSC